MSGLGSCGKWSVPRFGCGLRMVAGRSSGAPSGPARDTHRQLPTAVAVNIPPRWECSETAVETQAPNVHKESLSMKGATVETTRRRAGGAISLVLLAFLSTTASQISTPTPAYAVGCAGSGCDGKDPQASGCNDSRTYTTRTYQNHNINTGAWVATTELRWSPTCQTNWVRVTSRGGVVGMGALADRTSDARRVSMSGNYQVGWTDMLYAPTTTVCGVGWINNSTAPEQDLFCS
jgi:hypothetical protein